MELKFKEAFKRLIELKDKAYVLRANNVLIEIIDEEIKTKSGLIIQTSANQVHGMNENKGVIGYVLDVGAGYYDDETNETVPLDIKVGDIVLLPKYSVSLYSTFPGLNEPTNNKIGVTIDSEIKLIFKGEEGYAQAKEVLNEGK